MTKRPKVNWIFVKGADILCDRCGSKGKLLPNSVEGMKRISDDFTKEHSRCLLPEKPKPVPAWRTPLDWVVGEDTGTSSMAIWAVMMGANLADHRPPSDTSDFGRCYRLIRAFPEWEPRMPEVAERFPEWGPLVADWTMLMALYEEELAEGTGKAPRLYDAIKARLR